MSAESSNPSSLPGRNRPQLSDLSRETTEDDLWNLDEEPTPTLPLKPKLGPAAAVSSKEPAGGHEPAEPAGEPQAPAVPAETPPMPRGRHSAVKPLIPRTLPDEIGDLDEDDSKPETPSPKEEISPLTTAIDHHPADEEAEAPAAPAVATPPDKTRAKGKGRKSKAKAKDKTPAAPEEEIPAAVAEPEPEPEPVMAEPEPVVPEAELQPEPEIQPPAEPEPEPEPEPGPEAGPETEPEPEDSYGDYADEEPDEPQALRENRPRAATPAAKGPLPIARMNRREVIWVASFGVVVMIAAVWVLSHFFTQLSFTRDSDSKPKYPLKGELAWVASATTFWREPVRDGEDRDVARREVVLIPVLELSLDPSHSGGGAMRVIFRNSDGEPLGDPITRSFGAGRFEASGSSTMTFAATNGFTQDGDFQAYRTGRGKLWTADVLEGPPGDSQASDFKKISSIPLLPDRR